VPLENNHQSIRERNISVLSESPIKTCHLYQWVSLPRDGSFVPDPRHYGLGEVSAIKYSEHRIVKAPRLQNLFASALVGAPALVTTHAQTAPKTKITTEIHDRKSNP
jgi:hypothetical protein